MFTGFFIFVVYHTSTLFLFYSPTRHLPSA